MTYVPVLAWEETLETLRTGAYTEYRIPGIVATGKGTLPRAAPCITTPI